MGDETFRREGRRSSTLPCGCALPHVADAAFERLGGVPEGAHATVPVAVVGRLLGLSFWPLVWIEKYNKDAQNKRKKKAWGQVFFF